MRLLLIEDDKQLVELICPQLKERNIQTDVVTDGEEGLFLLTQNCYDGCILDRMLPKLDGLTLLRQARGQGVTTPVLMLTAMSRTQDLVDGLESGADDYLSKPFAMPELLARVAVLLRHGNAASASRLTAGDLTLNLEGLTLTGPKGTCTLSPKERDMLALLVQKAGEVISRETFFGNVWGAGAEVSESSLDTYICFLRRRIKTVGSSWKLTTRRGVGYLLEERP